MRIIRPTPNDIERFGVNNTYQGGGIATAPDWKAIGQTIGLRGQYDMTNDVTVNGSNEVTGLTDSSGNGNDLTHINNGSQAPGHQTDGCLHLNGNECFHSLDAITGSVVTDLSLFHMFIVLQFDPSNLQIAQWIMGGRNFSGAQRPRCDINSSSGAWAVDHSSTTDISSVTGDPMPIESALQVIDYRASANPDDGGNVWQWIYSDGVLLDSLNIGLPAANWYLNGVIGTQYYNTAAFSQYYKVRAWAFADDGALSIADAATYRSALMANFNSVSVY